MISASNIVKFKMANGRLLSIIAKNKPIRIKIRISVLMSSLTMDEFVLH